MTDTRELVDDLRGTNGGWAPDIALEAADTITALSDRCRALEEANAALSQAVQAMYDTSKDEIVRLTRHLEAIANYDEEVSRADGPRKYARAALTSGGRG